MSSEQFAAASPAVSSWISASAGSGKTKVLIDRLVRLLLEGEAFSAILCFTYTNAAAAEMRERLQRILREFAEMSPAARNMRLAELLLRPPTHDEQTRAETLFEAFTRNGSALRIQTIHSFCKEFLDAFALLMDRFGPINLLEGEASARLLHDIQETCLLTEDDPAFLEAFQTLSKFLTFDQIDEALLALLAQRYEFAQFLKQSDAPAFPSPEAGATAFETFLAEQLGVADPEPEFDAERIRSLAQTLQSEQISEGDQQTLLHAAGGQFAEAFLTKSQTVRKRLFSAPLQKRAPEACQFLSGQAERFNARLKHQKIRDQITKTRALITVARVIFQRYQEHKHRHQQADFDDLIAQTDALLTRAETEADLRQAILNLFPIRHLFLDEAQDTSPQQWQIALKIVQSLFSRNKKKLPCTLFVVGDIKQSIYSFQGAKPWLFRTLMPIFKQQVEEQGGTFQTVALQTSYRTAPAILEIVDAIFQRDSTGVAVEGEYRLHQSARSARGFVENWKVTRQERSPQSPDETSDLERFEEALARTVIDGVASLLERGLLLPSVDRPMRADDILILSRRRGPVLKLIADGLQGRKIAVAGLDKRVMSDTFEWKDLVALARFITEPNDDYNLACLLKSPILSNVTDEELWTLCAKRPGTLIDVLRASTDDPASLAARTLALLMPYCEEAKNAVTKDLFYVFWHRVIAAIRPLYDAQAEAVFETFLEAVQQFLSQSGPDWVGFLDFLRDRSFVQNAPATSGVRFMTVHGSKGLQAPVVIVLDEGPPLSLARERWFWFNEADEAEASGTRGLNAPKGVVLMPPQSMATPAIERLREKARSALLEEDRRLLYVALTRAQDGLIVVGAQEKKEHWSTLVAEATL